MKLHEIIQPQSSAGAGAATLGASGSSQSQSTQQSGMQQVAKTGAPVAGMGGVPMQQQMDPAEKSKMRKDIQDKITQAEKDLVDLRKQLSDIR